MKRNEAVISLTPCGFFRGYSHMKNGSCQCKLGNGQTRCGGDFTYCENLEPLKKYFREKRARMAEPGGRRGNGTD